MHIFFIQNIGLMLIAISAVIFHPGMAYLGLWTMIPTFGAALIIAAGHFPSKDHINPLTHPILVSIGIIDISACIAKNRMKHVEPVAKFLNVAANRFPNVYVLDLNDLVCPGGNCNATTKEGVMVFRDSKHLTDSFVRTQIPFIRAWLEKFAK